MSQTEQDSGKTYADMWGEAVHSWPSRGAAEATGPREGGVVAPPPLGRVVPSGDTAPESL